MKDVWKQVLIETIKKSCLETEHLQMIYGFIIETKLREMEKRAKK